MSKSAKKSAPAKAAPQPAQYEDYKSTATYTEASAAERTKLEAYKLQNNISDAHMHCLLLRQDLRALPKEEKQKGNRMAEYMTFFAVIIFLFTYMVNNRIFMAFGAVLLIAWAFIYLTGITNPYNKAVKKINTDLKKKFPEVPEYEGFKKKPEPKDEDEDK